MLNFKRAINSDVDLILDMKLDIIFNSEEIIDSDKSELEKIVNYAEENIRVNLDSYQLVYNDNDFIGVYAVVDYDENTCLLDMLYIKSEYRHQGYGTELLDIIINSTYKPICLWVYKSNENAITLYKEKGFDIVEKTDTRFFMKNENKKENNNLIKAMAFANEVQELSKKYGLEYYFVTEGAKSINYENNEIIKNITELTKNIEQ